MRLKFFLFVLSFLLVSDICNCFGAETYEIDEVAVYSTPGETITFFERGKPAEKIIARKQNNRYAIIICINSAVGKTSSYLETEAELSAAEWDSIIKIIRDNDLLSWKPVPMGYEVYDFGTTGFSITGKITNNQHWDTEIKNQGDISKLLAIMAKLAKEKIKSVQPYFISAQI